MGRRKSYDRDEVLERAMRLFWQQGFHATSTRELAQAMGVNVYSLYAEFESKEGLYRAALARYGETVVAGHFARMEAEGAGLADIHGVLGYFAGAARQDNPMLGCLSTNALVEAAPAGPASRETGGLYVGRLRAAFAHALTGAVAAGELVEDTPIDALASALAVTMLGVFVMLRAGGDADMVDATAAQALARVQAFEVSPQA
jgi:TetR/AcrR family transcriptional regulator, transcriptional repressor for nem operon